MLRSRRLEWYALYQVCVPIAWWPAMVEALGFPYPSSQLHLGIFKVGSLAALKFLTSGHLSSWLIDTVILSLRLPSTLIGEGAFAIFFFHCHLDGHMEWCDDGRVCDHLLSVGYKVRRAFWHWYLPFQQVWFLVPLQLLGDPRGAGPHGQARFSFCGRLTIKRSPFVELSFPSSTACSLIFFSIVLEKQRL